jgi:phosphatidylinositol alpha-1,6-mannosyltransferase
VDTTLHALSKVAQQVPDVTYLIVGEGPDRVRLETLADRLALRHRVRFLGRVPDEDRKTLYAASDLFVLAAREVRPDVEGFGLVMLEAAACGVPTIGTESGGVPETIVPGKTGLLVEPNNPEALATAMTELLLDAERRRQLGAAGRDYVSKSASWEQRAEQLFAVLSGTRSALRSEAPFAEFEGAAQP